MTQPDLAAIRAQLGAIEHERWAHWQKYLHDRCTRGINGSLVIPAALVERWERQIATEYGDLSVSEQASDLEEVDRYWPIIQRLLDAQAERLAQLQADQENWERMGADAMGHASEMADRIVELEAERDVQAERLARLENGEPAPTGIDALLTEAKAYLGGSFPLTPVHVQMARLVDALEAQVELRTRDQAALAAARKLAEQTHAAWATEYELVAQRQQERMQEAWDQRDQALAEVAALREALSWTIGWHGHILNCPGTTPGMSCPPRCAPTLAALVPPDPAS